VGMDRVEFEGKGDHEGVAMAVTEESAARTERGSNGTR